MENEQIPSRGSRVDRLNPHLIYVVQIKCAPYDRCSQCPWSDWYIIPPELKTQPTLVSVEKVDHPIAEGNRLVSLTWKAEETERPHGYFVSLQKASREPPSEGFNTSAGAITLLLSCSAYILNIRAFNNVSVSPALGQTITSCEGATSWDARRLNVTVHSNTSFTVAWEPQLSDHYVCYSVEWSRKNQQKTAYLSFFEDEQRNRTVDFTEPLEPYRRYVLSLHTRVNKETCNLEHINGSESTFGSVPFYFMEGSPISAPANMSYYNVTSSSLGLQWSPIPEEDLQGFLLGYYVYYKEYKQDARTAEKVVTVDADLTSCVVKALKPDTVYQVEVSGFTRAGTGVRSTVSFKTDKQGQRNTKAIFWPSIPNPENSNVIKKIEKSCEIELLEPLQTLKVEEWHTNGLQFIEEETVVRLSLPNLFAAEKKEGLTLEDVQEDTIKDMLDPPALLDLDGLPNPLTAFTCGYTTLEMFQQNVTFQCSQTISQEAEDQMQDEIKPVVDYIRQLSSTPSFDLSKTVNF
ncbi:oncostatin-M-specific receptor subunit beta [Eucyclogobius newberryi]|uniref:oncostatin-M-specific receptor subunit beta n=1 Tax=Eucyclogobius newberryi TaxID=166745 RepID=UPI003B59ECB2